MPLADLQRRFLPSLRNFFHLYLPLADHAALYDSTLQPPHLVAEWHHSELALASSDLDEQIIQRCGQ